MKQKFKHVNLYAGPGTGKSTTAARLFAELKHLGVNCEYIPEFAKDLSWEGRGPKIFRCQEYLFGEQSFRSFRTRDEVDVLITDSPLLLSCVYAKLTPEEDQLPSLPLVVREAYDKYDNLNVFLKRNKPYNPKGRNQSESEAKELDQQILSMLHNQAVPFTVLDYSKDNAFQIIELMRKAYPDLKLGSATPSLEALDQEDKFAVGG